LVLEANQVLLWSILAATGAKLQVDGYGRLFRVRSSVRPSAGRSPRPGGRSGSRSVRPVR
jgi:hypothetical protein